MRMHRCKNLAWLSRKIHVESNKLKSYRWAHRAIYDTRRFAFRVPEIACATRRARKAHAKPQTGREIYRHPRNSFDGYLPARIDRGQKSTLYAGVSHKQRRSRSTSRKEREYVVVVARLAEVFRERVHKQKRCSRCTETLSRVPTLLANPKSP